MEIHFLGLHSYFTGFLFTALQNIANDECENASSIFVNEKDEFQEKNISTLILSFHGTIALFNVL